MYPSIRTKFLAIASLAIAGSSLVWSAAAEEYCVTCTGPDAKYRCVIGNEAKPATRSEQGQLLCITELARSGNHASCSVGAVTSAPCSGDQRTVMFPTAPAPAPPPPAAATAKGAPIYKPAEGGAYSPMTDGEPEHADLPPGQQPGENGMQPATPAAPKTVEDLAKKTVQASREGLKNAGKAVSDGAQSAGNAVGNAAKKTWNCLSSFFGDC